MEGARLDWRTKGLPPTAEGLTGAEIGALGLDLLAGDLLLPAAVLREAALRHNIAAMQAFADRHGARLCPHGKTSMSPEILAMQLGAGALGLTAATAHHVRVYRRLGVGRIFLANQLAGRADVDFVAREIAADVGLDFHALIDSAEGAALAATAGSGERPVQVLIETGVAGGRAGLRDAGAALGLARTIAAEPRLALRGVETFEGVRQQRPGAREEAAAMIALATEAARAIAAERLFAPGPVLMSAGGSAFTDLCAARLPAALDGRPVERVIRPGCYVAHDHGLYARLARGEDMPALAPALEVWGAVLSLPEPGLAIVGVGKRDVSTDVEPPVPLWTHRPGAGGGPNRADGFEVAGLWDQHASLGVPPGALAVGDLVGFGISHPCATFDRWRALLTVDERRRVTGAVTTLF